MEKKIETIELRARDINNKFGNPRKISAKKVKELKESLDTFGDFGCFVVDENNSVISGNQRLSIIQQEDPDRLLTCKRLIGYSTAEKKAINIKANTHAGEWDVELLADWTSDLQVDLGLNDEVKKQEMEERSIKEMELIHYEKYDYVLIACRSEIDYNDLTRKLGIAGKVVKIANRKIKARAIWYDQIKCNLVEAGEKTEA